jgi:hypothetical protein
MTKIRKYPKGATHCVYPNAFHDEMFYRLAWNVLEFFNMNRHEWYVSDRPVEFLDNIHKLEDPDAVIG